MAFQVQWKVQRADLFLGVQGRRGFGGLARSGDVKVLGWVLTHVRNCDYCGLTLQKAIVFCLVCMPQKENGNDFKGIESRYV